MSVIITGEKIEDCYDCIFHRNLRTNDYGTHCECSFDDEYNTINILEHKIPSFCPLKSIDGLIERINKKANSGQWSEAVVYGMQKAIAIIKEYCEVDK